MSKKESQKAQHSRLKTDGGSSTSFPAQASSEEAEKTRFERAKAILDGKHGFAGALWDVQLREAWDSRKKIEAAQLDAKKTIFNECMHTLRESMVAEIQRWAPHYSDLATAYPQFAKPDPVHWIRHQMETVIKRRLRKPDLDGAVAWCLITMTGGNVLEKDAWRPPDWARAGSALSFILSEHKDLLFRLDYALEQAIARLELRHTIGNAGHPDEPPLDRQEQLKLKQIYPDGSQDARLKRTIANRYLNEHPFPSAAEMVAWLQSKQPLPGAWETYVFANWMDAFKTKPKVVRRLLSGITGDLRKHGYDVGRKQRKRHSRPAASRV